MQERKPLTNASKNEKLLGGRAPLHDRVDKILDQKKKSISKVATDVATQKKMKEEEEAQVEYYGTEKIIHEKEKRRKELAMQENAKIDSEYLE